MSEFVVEVTTEDFPEDPGEITLLAPSLITQLPDTPENCVRLASFIALAFADPHPNPTVKSDEAWKHVVMLAALAPRNTDPVAVMRVHSLDQSEVVEYLWPKTHKLRDLAIMGRVEVKRVALSEFIQPASPTIAPHSPKPPKF